MKLKTKKNIAREFLFFFLCISVAVLFFGGTYGYNFIRKTQANNVHKDIINESFTVDSLLNIKNMLIESSKEEDTLSKKRTFLENDEIYDIPFFLVETFLEKHPGAIEKKSFRLFQDTFNIDFCEIHNFITENPEATPIYVFSRNDTINIHKSNIKILKTKKDNYENKVLPLDIQLTFVKYLLFGLFILFFGLRYLFYTFRWSLKTLKQKTE